METTKKDLEYYRKNAEEDYLTTPISVLRYVTEMEQALRIHDVVGQREQLKAFVEKWNVENDLACSPIIHEGFVDEFLKSL